MRHIAPAELPVASADGVVFHLMRRVLQQHAARWTAVLPELTKSQWAVLQAVAAESDNDQNLIGERTAIDKATLVPLVSRLVDRGLLVREPDEKDRRRRHLSLTAEGRAVLEQATPLVARVDAEALGSLGTEQRVKLRDLLLRLA